MQFDTTGNYCRALALALYLLTGAASAASAQAAKEDTSEIAALRAEVKQLASELLQHRSEYIQWKMHWIRIELEQVKAERQRLAAERQTIEREIGELNLASTNSPGAEDAERQEELKNVQVPALLAHERAVTARETALSAALNTESASMAGIQKQLERLTSQPRK